MYCNFWQFALQPSDLGLSSWSVLAFSFSWLSRHRSGRPSRVEEPFNLCLASQGVFKQTLNLVGYCANQVILNTVCGVLHWNYAWCCVVGGASTLRAFFQWCIHQPLPHLPLAPMQSRRRAPSATPRPQRRLAQPRRHARRPKQHGTTRRHRFSLLHGHRRGHTPRRQGTSPTLRRHLAVLRHRWPQAPRRPTKW